jgi:prepilin-type N-terminal cleavage/methylation domain-containing protein/prepilin-type processing-associated H-X9-DG protein
MEQPRRRVAWPVAARRRSAAAPGFTLIELLVVIAIIGILAAMLFPVFARARESARKIQCLANVKNIALATNMYLTDYQAFPPGAHDPDLEAWLDANCTGAYAPYAGKDMIVYMSNPYLRWPVLLDEYIKNRDVWRCPSTKWSGDTYWIAPDYYPDGYLGSLKRAIQDGLVGKGEAPLLACQWAYPPGWGGSVTDSYAQQMMASGGSSGKGPDAHGVEFGIACNETLMGLKESSMEDPASLVITGDTNPNLLSVAVASYAWWRPWSARGGMAFSMAYDKCCPLCESSLASCNEGAQTCGFADEAALHRFLTDPSERRKWTRHMGGINVGFADGHAKWYDSEAFLAQVPVCQGEYGYGTVITEGRPLRGFCTAPAPW